MLGLNICRGQHSVNGIGNSVAQPLGSLSCELKPSGKSLLSSNIKFEALVLSAICADQPAQPIDSSAWSHIRNLPLADPDFAHPGPVDILLGADIFASSLLPGLRKGNAGQPKALNTIFGWIILGECDVNRLAPKPVGRSNNNCLLVSNISQTSLDNSIKRFWEIENVNFPQKSYLSKEDQLCESYFVDNHFRNHVGRFVVPLPFVDPTNKPVFVNSREIALKRLFSLERKLNTSPALRAEYVAFIEDYKERGHLEEVDPPPTSEGRFYYIPHHGILRPESVSTPLRVIFDASARDGKAVSLNETLLAGPKLQTNIFDLLMRFRWHAVVFTGDVKQMYRQILVPEEDVEYQRILWRPSADGPVRDYRLLTVTYGVSSAPFQALRTMAQLATDSAEEYPAGSEILSRDICVDEVVTGANSVEEACSLQMELTKILSSALTPGHFLTLEPMTIMPEENLVGQNIGALQRWKLIQQMHQDFWVRWRNEYMHTLRQRAKWDKTNANITVGTMVLVVNELLSPQKWPLGRIVALHPGLDGICRVVTVRTAAGHYKRPVVKICPLPLANNLSN
ncbi:uncharacterized protein LOC135078303 [Ostrinia nubilalis]|uniref:uncharacterized protein LOC135078303 n=1 Tax=Ostrinia nubilalis TaxID=29057 RepID=UPI0030825A12